MKVAAESPKELCLLGGSSATKNLQPLDLIGQTIGNSGG